MMAQLVCAGLLFVAVVVGAVKYMDTHRGPPDSWYRNRPAATEEEDDEPPPEEWSAGRGEDRGMSTVFETRDEAEEFACSPDGDGWIYSDETGWMQVSSCP